MISKLFFDILSPERKKILPHLRGFKDTFYLAGGTALALQLGHRDSVDFDFFTSKKFQTEELFKKNQTSFPQSAIQKMQEENGTLSVSINQNIRLSFFYYPYKMISNFIDADYFFLASLADIGCMKLNAITSRSLQKDYVDLYFILGEIPLARLLDFASQKLPELDTNLILKSLIYFADIQEEPIVYKNDQEVEFSKVKAFLIQETKKYSLP